MFPKGCVIPAFVCEIHAASFLLFAQKELMQPPIIFLIAYLIRKIIMTNDDYHNTAFKNPILNATASILCIMLYAFMHFLYSFTITIIMFSRRLKISEASSKRVMFQREMLAKRTPAQHSL